MKPGKLTNVSLMLVLLHASPMLAHEPSASSPDMEGTKSAKPNVIVIYTDDQGYGDASVLNPDAKFQTPNLDRLANEGIAFTNGHSADSVCTPSRYGLLTGRYPWRTTLKRNVMGSEGTCLIPDGRMTLASLLRDQGYHTGMVGKWHLGMDFPGTHGQRDWTQPTLDMPLDKGFDYFYGVPASLNFGVLAWFENRHAAVPPTLYTRKKPNRRASDYRIKPPYDVGEDLDKQKKRKSLEAAPDFVDNECLTRFTDKAIQWMTGKVDDAKQGKPFFLYLPYTSPHYPVCPLPEFHGQGSCGAYGEFLIETDHHVGRILEFLKTNGLDDNTLVVFTSDNGPENRWKQSLKEYQHDSRGGLKQGKRSVYEGGHRVPLFVRWPKGIANPSRKWDGSVGQIDLLATIAELVGASLPDNAGEDSQSFASVLLDPNSNHQRLPLINHGNGGGSFRYSVTDKNWKLVLPEEEKPFELYDLSVDRSETKNVADQHPEIVERLTKRINQIITQGRTTEGQPQANDTDHWEDLHWISKKQYQAQVAVGASKPNAQPDDVYAVYLLAGQSNMDGRGNTKDLTLDQQRPFERAIIYYRNPPQDSDGWQPLAPGFSIPPRYKGSVPSPTFGPEIQFARGMIDAHPNRKIALIKASEGGTSLRKDWKPGEKDKPETQGECYRDFVETIRMATEDLSKAGHRFEIRGLLWHQGESDSKAKTKVYQRRFLDFVDRIREDVGNENLPVVVGEVFDNGKRDKVRDALLAVGTSGPLLGFVSSEGTTTFDEGTHFDAASQVLLGSRFAEAVLKIENANQQSGNPR